MEDLDYIKKFSKISIKSVCEKAKVDTANLYSGKTSKKNIKKVRKYIESNIAELYLLNEENAENEEKSVNINKKGVINNADITN